MKRLISKIYRSAQRLRAFYLLLPEEKMAEEALRREIKIHFWYSLKLYLKSIFGKRRQGY